MTVEQIVITGLVVEALASLVLLVIDARMIVEMFKKPVKHYGIALFNSRCRQWADEVMEDQK